MTAVVEAPAPDRSVATLAARLTPAMPSSGWRSWIGPLLVTAVAGVLRLWNLGFPHAINFDETYYPKDALALLRFGVERAMVDGANETLLASDGNWRTLEIFKPEGAFVVHPPLGKWTIAAGEFIFGATPFGWRFAVAVLGTLAVLVTARIVRRMTRSDLIGTLAGLLLALEGMHIVLSRTGLLDGILGFWILIAFACLVMDRDHVRARLARMVSSADGPAGVAALAAGWGPSLGIRWWRIAAIIALGLAAATKWSALWFIAFFILMSLVWDVGARRMIGVSRPWVATLLRSVPSTAVLAIGLIIGIYLLSWTGWFLSDDGWGRTWAASQGPSFVPDALRSLWHYHAEAWNFHVKLSSPHSYKSNPLSWPFQSRPTSFYWNSVKDGAQGCPTNNCAGEVLALGNPIIWWAAIVAMIHQTWRWVTLRDWRAGAVMVGIAAGWLPWMLYLDRTIFTFYTVVYAPFVCMALAMSMGALLGPADASEKRRARGAFAAGTLLVLIVITAWWFYPIWTGQLMPYEQWQLRMWMPTWV